MSRQNPPVTNISEAREDREARSYDFGRMAQRVPASVATPRSTEEVSNLVRKTARDKTQLAIRGAGHSQGEQSLTDCGLVLDMTELNRVQLLEQGLVHAQGGASWGKVLDTLRGTQQLPPVLADIAEVTVGGTLSAGGWGSSSHRHGMQIDNVEQLEVVTGTGASVRCSRTENADLFNAVRAGQGQFGIITDAWLQLRKAKERIRVYRLHYQDFDRFASDYEQIASEGRFDHLRAEVRLHQKRIILTAGIEYDEDCDDEEVLEGLGHDEGKAIRDTTDVGYAGVFPKWGFLWMNYHPWRDWFLPWEALRTLLAQPWLDPSWIPQVPASWTGTYPLRTGSNDAPLLMCPEGERVFSYSVLTVHTRHERASELAERLREIDRTLIELGGKSYLSGGTGYGHEEWQEHYGEKFEMALAWKEEFDPKQVFQGGNMPFSESPETSG